MRQFASLWCGQVSNSGAPGTKSPLADRIININSKTDCAIQDQHKNLKWIADLYMMSDKLLYSDKVVHWYMILITGHIKQGVWQRNLVQDSSTSSCIMTMIHYNDLSVTASQITGNSTICSPAYVATQQTKYQSLVLLAFCEGIHQSVVVPLTKSQ